MLELTIDPEGSLPPYAQVRQGILARITTGVLRPGERLPTVRQLAQELGLAANTVARAYRELEQAGLVETRGRHGTVVAAQDAAAWRSAAQAADRFVAEVVALGLPATTATVLVAEAVARTE